MEGPNLSKIIAVFLLCALAPGQPRLAFADTEEPIYQDEFFETQEYFAALSYGASFGLRALGHFGQTETILAPKGGFAVEPSAFVWYKHLVQVRGALGFAMSDPRFYYGSIGGRATILEVIVDERSEHKGIQGGLVLKALDSFMIYASLNLNIIHFPVDPTRPNAFSGTTFTPSFGAGIEVRIYKGADEIQNVFADLGLSFLSIQGAKFLSPVLSIGAEFR